MTSPVCSHFAEFAHRTALALALALTGVSSTAVSAATISTDGKPAVAIVLAADAIPAERTAAQEVADYLERVSGGKFAVANESEAKRQAPAIYVGPTAYAKRQGIDPTGWGPERWTMRTVGENVVLAGGRPRGTLYCAYRFLEDVAGVRWWNAYEESVPKRPTLQVATLDRQGEPAFRYRDIYLLYANDGGRFAARSRINRQGGEPIAVSLGGSLDYGPPYACHTFYKYIPPQEYFDKHPEWFSLIGGKRTSDHAQLCLSNPGLRAAIIEKLIRYIEQTRAEAKKTGNLAPTDFDISQNDWQGACECPQCKKIVDREGSESGPLIDFLNCVSDAIRDKYPEVHIVTLAYQYTENPPKTVRPRDNIILRLCHTSANLLQPVTHPDGRTFADRLATWGRISKNLRIWDYAVTYSPYYGLPLPTVQTYPIDYQYFAKHNVEGVFTEHEYPILADLRDLKVWTMMKMLEDPYRDCDALVQDFTDGFYGPAGPAIRRYLTDLQTAAEARHGNVDWYPVLSQYTYLTLEFLRNSQAMFDGAEKAVAGNPVLLRRVRHARLPVDRACLVLWSNLVRQWRVGGGKPEKTPLEREAIARRCRETWYAQIDFRIPKSQRPAQRAEADAELSGLLARVAYVPLPERFRAMPPKDVFDFTVDQSSFWSNQVKRIPDAEAECGTTNRLELTDEDMKKYKLPMLWGVYDPSKKQEVGSGTIESGDVPGPGYHWYKLVMNPVTPSNRVHFFWSWIVDFRVDAAIDPEHPKRKCEVWARIKFEGPGFPHTRANQKNAICVERVVVVRHE
jgi:hypothetical protein